MGKTPRLIQVRQSSKNYYKNHLDQSEKTTRRKNCIFIV